MFYLFHFCHFYDVFKGCFNPKNKSHCIHLVFESCTIQWRLFVSIVSLMVQLSFFNVSATEVFNYPLVVVETTCKFQINQLQNTIQQTTSNMIENTKEKFDSITVKLYDASTSPVFWVVIVAIPNWVRASKDGIVMVIIFPGLLQNEWKS